MIIIIIKIYYFVIIKIYICGLIYTLYTIKHIHTSNFCIVCYLCIYLENGNFITQLTFLLGGKSQLINDLYGNISACFPVFSCIISEMIIYIYIVVCVFSFI